MREMFGKEKRLKTETGMKAKIEVHNSSASLLYKGEFKDLLSLNSGSTNVRVNRDNCRKATNHPLTLQMDSANKLLNYVLFIIKRPSQYEVVN